MRYHRLNVNVIIQEQTYQQVNLADFTSIETNGGTICISVDKYSPDQFTLSELNKHVNKKGGMQAILYITSYEDPNKNIDIRNVTSMNYLAKGQEIIWTLK